MRGISVNGFAFREHTTGGLRPPLLCCGARVCRRKPIFAMYIRTSDQERRASARRGSVNRTLCRENRTLSSGCRTHSHERRASARRGSVTAPAMAIGFRGVITFTTHDRMVRHGWLTPAAPGARRQSPEKQRHSRCTNARSTRAAGVSPPWFGEPNAVPRESNIVQRLSNAQSRAAGVSPPWAWETHLQERCRKVAVDCHRCAHERLCSGGRKPTGG